MNREMRCSFVILVFMTIAFAVQASAMQQGSLDFSRYNVILARRPFGTSAASATQATPPPPQPKPVSPQDSFAKDYRMCAIRDGLAGVSVGLVNVGAKPVTSFFLFTGDSEDGIQLVEADFAEEKALLRKGDEECWIYMNGGVRSVAAAGGMIPGASDGLIGVQGLISSRLAQLRRSKPVPFTGLTKEEYNEKRASGEIPPPIPARNFLPGRAPQVEMTREEREAKLSEYNMELIRAGGEKGLPLPIPLTQEQDDQLVAEGVLPAR